MVAVEEIELYANVSAVTAHFGFVKHTVVFISDEVIVEVDCDVYSSLDKHLRSPFPLTREMLDAKLCVVVTEELDPL
jgi:hypothetical protein